MGEPPTNSRIRYLQVHPTAELHLEPSTVHRQILETITALSHSHVRSNDHSIHILSQNTIKHTNSYICKKMLHWKCEFLLNRRSKWSAIWSKMSLTRVLFLKSRFCKFQIWNATAGDWLNLNAT